MIRNRTKRDSFTPTGVWYSPYLPPATMSWGTFTPILSQMVDRSKDPAHIKPCSHQSWKHAWKAVSFEGGNNNGTTTGQRAVYGLGYGAMWWQNGMSSFRPPIDAVQTVLDNFLSDTQGHLDSTGLCVSFTEIGELKSLIPGLVSSLKQIVLRSGNPLVHLAGLFLADKFAIEPLRQDVGNLLGFVNRIQTKLNQLAYRSGKTVTIRKRLRIPISVPDEQPEPVSSPYGPTYRDANVIVSVHGEYVVVVGGRCFSRLNQDLESAAQHLILEYLGLNRPLTWVWETIPFSFLIDWAVDIQSKIQDLEEDILPNLTKGLMSNVLLKDMWWSTKRTETFSVVRYRYQGNPGSYIRWNPWPICDCTYTDFSRSSDWSNLNGRLPRGWSLTQTLLSASLAVQALGRK